jgi:hypothetical protein
LTDRTNISPRRGRRESGWVPFAPVHMQTGRPCLLFLVGIQAAQLLTALILGRVFCLLSVRIPRLTQSRPISTHFQLPGTSLDKRDCQQSSVGASRSAPRTSSGSHSSRATKRATEDSISEMGNVIPAPPKHFQVMSVLVAFKHRPKLQSV